MLLRRKRSNISNLPIVYVGISFGGFNLRFRYTPKFAYRTFEINIFSNNKLNCKEAIRSQEVVVQVLSARALKLFFFCAIMGNPKGLRRDTPILRLIAQRRQRSWYHQLSYEIRCIRRIEYRRLHNFLYWILALYSLLAVILFTVFPYWQPIYAAASTIISWTHTLAVEVIMSWLACNMFNFFLDPYSQLKNCMYFCCM